MTEAWSGVVLAVKPIDISKESAKKPGAPSEKSKVKTEVDVSHAIFNPDPDPESLPRNPHLNPD